MMHKLLPCQSKDIGARQAAWLVAAAAILLPDFALAHEGVAGGLASGFAHPILGPDHVVAMVAVGLWGAFLGQPAMWLLPVVFPVVMAFGGLLGINGVPLPGVEIGIAASAVALGAVVALALRPPCGSRPCSSAPLRSSTVTPMARSCPRRRTRWPTASASWSRPAFCISRASRSVCWRAGRWACGRCASGAP
jgi:HupE / UreJ protein